MAIKSGIFSVITGIVLILLLGNPPLGDNLPDDGPVTITAYSVNGFFTWNFADIEGTFRTAQIALLVVFLVAVFFLGAVAGRARPLAAFLGGWGAAIGAAAIAGIVFSLIVGDDLYAGGGAGVIDRMFLSASDAAGVMVVVGWLFGIAVMLGSFGKGQPKAAPAAPQGGYAPPPPGPGPGPGYADAGYADPGFSPPPAAPPRSPPPPAAAPSPPPPAPAPGGPHIGPPPDRTQVYGHPPQQ